VRIWGWSHLRSCRNEGVRRKEQGRGGWAAGRLVPGLEGLSAVGGWVRTSREDELEAPSWELGAAGGYSGHVPAWRVCQCAVHGGSRGRDQRMADGRWQMADGRWQMQRSSRWHGGRRMLRRGERGERGEHLARAGMQRR
jgi:hypothetical protein